MKYAPYSYSKIEKASCPFLFKWVYIDRKKRIEKQPLGGRTFHEGARAYVEHCMKTNQQSDLDAAVEIWERSCEKEKLPLDQNDLYADMFDRFARATVIKPKEVLALEKELAFREDFKTCGWWDKDCMVRMKIDRIDCPSDNGEVPVIIDYKTQFNLPNQGEVERDRQLKMYAWGGLRVMFPRAEEIIGRFVFPRYGCAPRQVKFTRQDIDKIEAQVMQKISRIEKRTKWNAIPGDQCVFCPIMKECPIRNENPYLDVTSENAAEAAQQFIMLTERLKKLKKALSKYAKEKGPIDAGNRMVGYFEKEKRSMDTEKALAWLREHTPDSLDDCVNVPLTGLKKRVGEGYDELIEAACIQSIKSEFGAIEKDESKGE